MHLSGSRANCLGQFQFFHKYYREPSGDIQKITNQCKKSRFRINNEVASYVLRNGDCYVRYLDIKVTTALLADGVHLNELGSNILLNTITGALETFAKAYKLPDGCGGMTYPDQLHQKLFNFTQNFVDNWSEGQFQLTLLLHIILLIIFVSFFFTCNCSIGTA